MSYTVNPIGLPSCFEDSCREWGESSGRSSNRFWKASETVSSRDKRKFGSAKGWMDPNTDSSQGRSQSISSILAIVALVGWALHLPAQEVIIKELHTQSWKTKKDALVVKRLAPDGLCCLILGQPFLMHGKMNFDYSETYCTQDLLGWFCLASSERSLIIRPIKLLLCHQTADNIVDELKFPHIAKMCLIP